MDTAVGLVTGPPGERLAEPDASGQAVLRAVASGGPVAVAGAPGTGKTDLALTLTVQASQSGQRVVLVSPTRQTAGWLRSRLERAAGSLEGQLVMTPVALAQWLLRWRADAIAATGAAALATAELPQMVTGADQDAAIASLLQGQLLGDVSAVAWPPTVAPAVLGMAAFHDELRDLMMRAAERGLGPEGMAALGRQHHRPEWEAAAQVYDTYLDTLGLRTAGDAGWLLDAAAMVAAAAGALDNWEQPIEPRAGGESVQLGAHSRPRFDLVVVDDYQEAGSALAHLVGGLARDGAQVVLLGCPDLAVQGYRGALPELLAQACQDPPSGIGAQLLFLETCHRQGGELAQVTGRISQAVRPGQLGQRLRQPLGGVADQATVGQASGQSAGGSTELLVLGSAAQVGAGVAQLLRRRHLIDGVPWRQMAVLTRTAGQVALLRTALMAAAVPVHVPGSEVLTVQQPAVQALLNVLSLATSQGPPAASQIIQLLTGPIGQIDQVGLRRLRRVLAARAAAGLTALDQGQAPADGATEQIDAKPTTQPGPRGQSVLTSEPVPQTGTDGLLVEVVLNRVTPDGLPEELAEHVHRAAAVLAAGRVAAAQRGANAGSVLWAIWQASGLAEGWCNQALAGGAMGQTADAMLDAVCALFAAAQRYDARAAGAGPAAFARALAAQRIPSDTVAAHAPAGDRVTLATATAAVGREWDTVVVTGLQDGVWPNTRLRDTLLGAGQLADLLDDKGGVQDYLERRRAVIDDEARLAVLAVSRARAYLGVVVESNEDTRPSAFAELIMPPDQGVDPERWWRARPAPRPLDLRGLVASARATLIDAQRGATSAGGSGVAPAGDQGVNHAQSSVGLAGTDSRTDLTGEVSAGQAAAVLGIMADLGVTGANPEEWPGVIGLSSSQPLYPADRPVGLSPSSLETLDACPLRWVLEKVSGPRPGGEEATLGSLIHDLASEFPEAGVEILGPELDRRWDQLDLPPGYSARLTRQRAVAMVRRLGEYQTTHPAPLASEVQIEGSFPLTDAEFGSPPRVVKIRGRIDRLEAGPDGEGVKVVDFKTGQNLPTVKAAKTNVQLGVYQLVVAAGGVPALGQVQPTGAALVGLGGDGVGASLRQQPALAEEGLAETMAELLERCHTSATSPTLTATVNDTCRHCKVVGCCPVQPAGEQVTV